MRSENIFHNPPVRLNQFCKFLQSKSLVPSREQWNSVFVSNQNGPTTAGLYCFWWLGDINVLKKGSRDLIISGKKVSERTIKQYGAETVDLDYCDEKNHIKHHVSWDFRERVNGSYTAIPLYVGKTSNVFNRIKQQLYWPDSQKCRDGFGLGNGVRKIYKPTTACQLRAGFEYLFQWEDEKTRRQYLRDHIGLTVHFTGIDDIKERFYLENLLIGQLRPPFNLDSER